MAATKIVEGLRGVGVALLDAFRGIIAGPVDEPPVGAQDTFGYPVGAAQTAAPIGGGLILLILLGVLLFRR